MKSEDLVWWALTVRIPETTHRIGVDRLSRVLAALAYYANSDGNAWPSAGRIAEDLTLPRRIVREAFAALEAAGLIARVELPRIQSVAWTFAPIQSGDLAGIPATHRVIHMAGTPASEVAGQVAGQVAGRVAGIPATKRREGNYKNVNTPTTTMVTVQPGVRCAPGEHRLLPDGTCMNCDIRAEGAA